MGVNCPGFDDAPTRGHVEWVRAGKADVYMCCSVWEMCNVCSEYAPFGNGCVFWCATVEHVYHHVWILGSGCVPWLNFKQLVLVLAFGALSAGCHSVACAVVKLSRSQHSARF